MRSSINRFLQTRAAWWLVFIAALVPVALLGWQVVDDALGPDPAEAVMEVTGEWGLRLLLLTLLISPLRANGVPSAYRFRRMLGLYAFFYICLHLLLFAQVYIGWDYAILLEELSERPYIFVGFAGWVLLLPLVLTSTTGVRQRLGRVWVQLHKLIYAIGVLGIIHIYWLARSDIQSPLVYGALLFVLLFWRVNRYFLKLF